MPSFNASLSKELKFYIKCRENLHVKCKTVVTIIFTGHSSIAIDIVIILIIIEIQE